VPETLNDLDGLVLFAIGRTPVTLGGVIVGLLIIVGGFVAARLAGVAFRRARGKTRH
jgi:small-conductance mechanosensitive channel